MNSVGIHLAYNAHCINCSLSTLTHRSGLDRFYNDGGTEQEWFGNTNTNADESTTTTSPGTNYSNMENGFNNPEIFFNVNNSNSSGGHLTGCCNRSSHIPWQPAK